MKRIAINGLGRIGRLILRHYLTTAPADLEIVAGNDLTPIDDLLYLMKYDSVHGPVPFSFEAVGDQLHLGDKRIRYCSIKNPLELPWQEMGVDIVLECTGRFTKRDDAGQHLQAGATKVIISAPAKSADITCVMGVNETDYDPKKHHIVSNASCTTNALAPVLKVLANSFGISSAMVTTLHAYTATQALVDRPARKRRRGRAAAVSLIPTSTGAAEAITLVLPELKDKIDAIAVRAPVPDGALVDVVAYLDQNVSAAEVNQSFHSAATSKMKNILDITEEMLVSSDIIGNRHSAIIDAPSTRVIQGRVVKVLAWYDNEAGYAKRMLDMATYISNANNS